MRVHRASFAAAILFLYSTDLCAETAASEWTEVARSPEVTVYRKEFADSPIHAYRADAQLAAALDKVVAVVVDTKRRPEWAERVREATVLQQISATEHIEHVVTRVPWPLKDRDFVVQTKLIPDRASKTLRIEVRSVEHPKAPETGKYVRGIIHRADFVLKATEQGKATEVKSESHVDPKGSIPSWIINLIQKSFPRKSVANLMKQAAKPDIVPHPLVAQFGLMN